MEKYLEELADLKTDICDLLCEINGNKLKYSYYLPITQEQENLIHIVIKLMATTDKSSHPSLQIRGKNYYCYINRRKKGIFYFCMHTTPLSSLSRIPGNPKS
jgi:hypothetical protein